MKSEERRKGKEKFPLLSKEKLFHVLHFQLWGRIKIKRKFALGFLKKMPQGLSVKEFIKRDLEFLCEWLEEMRWNFLRSESIKSFLRTSYSVELNLR